jgi:hypothetical protein
VVGAETYMHAAEYIRVVLHDENLLVAHCSQSSLAVSASKMDTVSASTRISCAGWWLRRTSCGFP